ncbi:methyl-accepting chemotaxis protein [Marinospirillum alkaliphilum]|uniref:Methyl-accepting chemotaxis sensory transducer with Pas/Pac sensor n=1 Tax=Marinospirillum alkaliphilum DSM 21637 TaxID=1122209 RepID=A0A1K1Y436_9GAMM|nr:PAS domain-containing methyl-accepting chemotaxis protein [Marinospirillum alkaliphilum]SFX56093.1 methyl-accepting chemotaxis sensory transducer with Pas/Pac sensor [Marinospirillum alkaliphilum DSM 21637]
MRNNGPVTQQERLLKPHQKLISTTDLRGIIRHCNDDFVCISGFSREELIGQNHNLVRHPDMPPEAFAVLWQHLQAGRPWMGLVKNRCKNGDHYWVSAYVTPVTENGKVVGYESVRSCPARVDVERAERLYQRLRAGKRKVVLPDYLPLFGLALILLIAVQLMGWMAPLIGQIALLLALPLLAFFAYLQQRRQLGQLERELAGSFMHPLAVASYTDASGQVARLQTGVMSMKAHLDTVLTRMEDASAAVARQCLTGLELAETAQQQISQQHEQTRLAATAMHQMTVAINDISQNVQATAATAEQTRQLSLQGRTVALNTQQAITRLRDTVAGISQAVVNLADQTQAITATAEIIEKIAEQTNLLALNASIEAARAGDQGRGFSVVADEVRSLASSTRDSTETIRDVVSRLAAEAETSVRVASQGAATAEESVQCVTEAEKMLGHIADQVEQITAMAAQMATAVEEQSHVADSVNEQIDQIAGLASSSLEKTCQAANRIQQSRDVSDELHELVVRFRQ